MTNKTYDRVKWVALVFLPAVATLYFALGQIWNFPNVEQVMGTITALDTFLGLLIGKSSNTYKEITDRPAMMGHLTLVQDVDGTPMTIRMDPDDKTPVFKDGTTVAFKVRRESIT